VAEQYDGRAEIRTVEISTAEQISAGTAGADALLVATHRLDADRIAALAPTVRVIGRTGVGLDSLDLAAATDHGVTIISQPGYGSTEVALHAITMILTLHRRLARSDAYVRAGWSGPLTLTPMPALDRLTLGLVGCGRIGSEVVRMATPLVGRTLVYDPYASAIPDGATPVDSLPELLAGTDILSLHLPVTNETRGLLGASALDLLPACAIVINVARGGILDEHALAARLVDGRIRGAGLDVFAVEPLPADSPLRAAPNTVFSPHVAAFSDPAMGRLISWTIDDVLSWLDRREITHGYLAVVGSR
jgi:D-3-phosphoglycerate dehydrogenase